MIVGNRVPAAMWGIPLTCIVLLVNSLVGLRYAQPTPPGHWHDRIPIVGFESIVTNSPEGKVYQGVMLFLLSLLPAAVLIHFWRIFNSAKVVTTDDPPKLVSSIWDWSALAKLDDPARICTDVIREGRKMTCEKNATLLPGLEPTLFAVLTAVAVLALVIHWRAVFRRSPKHVE
ncbi:hypothetical protein [Bradyrhizobium murdochi]|uniref:hypothetical protein n=1 Tax=Bradyrhizobium murdochi TaxID=1038859 RepID=UPI0004037D49|nr:hypothetical protein [Bradyrhizobium murdochi]